MTSCLFGCPGGVAGGRAGWPEIVMPVRLNPTLRDPCRCPARSPAAAGRNATTILLGTAPCRFAGHARSPATTRSSSPRRAQAIGRSRKVFDGAALGDAELCARQRHRAGESTRPARSSGAQARQVRRPAEISSRRPTSSPTTPQPQFSSGAERRHRRARRPRHGLHPRLQHLFDDAVYRATQIVARFRLSGHAGAVFLGVGRPRPPTMSTTRKAPARPATSWK